MADKPPEKERDSDQDFQQIQNALAFLAGVRHDFDQSPVPESDIESRPTELADTQVDQDTPTPDETAPRYDSKQPGIGRFVVDRQIGQGGFAQVYLANDPKLNRQVAIKVLKPTLFGSTDASARFDRESQAAAVLSHPNIVPVFEAGNAGAVRYIASAYVEGITLEHWFKQQARQTSPRHAAKIVATLADAVEHAHQRGIIHRDLKPANILVEVTASIEQQQTLEIQPGDLRITDFGLARYADSMDQFQTAEGAIVGTPVYMSPEQADENQEITSASDIYSLGVILYELLTGKLPIIGKTHIDTLLAIKQQEPKPPRQINGQVPKDLQAICLKCLAKSPSARYSTAHELGRDLQRWLDGEVVSARNANVFERSAKWIARHPVPTFALIGISAALLIALTQWRTAVSENQRADRHLDLSQSVINEMVTRVAMDPNLPPELRRSIAKRAVDLQVQLLNEAPEDDELILQTAHAYRQFATVLNDLSEYDEALDAINSAIELVEPSQGEENFESSKMASVRVKSAILTYSQRPEEAIAALNEAETNTELPLLELARNRMQDGVAKMNADRLDDAIVDFETALVIYESIDDPHITDLEMARLFLFYGVTEMKMNRLDEAEQKVDSARSIFESTHLEKTTNTDALENDARCNLQLARIKRAQFQVIEEPSEADLQLVEDSRAYFDRAVTLYKRLIEQQPLLFRAHGSLTMTYEIRLRLEVEQQDKDFAIRFANEFQQLFDNLPDQVKERPIIGRILAESRIKVAKMLIEIDEAQAAQEQLKPCQNLLQNLIREYPQVDRLDSLKNECEQLLKNLKDQS